MSNAERVVKNLKPRNTLRQTGETGLLQAMLERVLRDLGILVDVKAEGFQIATEVYECARDWVLYRGPGNQDGGFTADELFEYLDIAPYYLRELRRRLRH